MNTDDARIAVEWLGYGRPPLAVESAKQREVLAYDIRRERVVELQVGADQTLEVAPEELTKSFRAVPVRHAPTSKKER